jgi:hypothetical protein
MVAAGLAEPRHVADRNLGDVLYEHRHAVRLAERNVLDVLDLVALGQIRFAAAVHQVRRREFTDCWPTLMVRPPTLMLALPSALITCGSVTP